METKLQDGVRFKKVALRKGDCGGRNGVCHRSEGRRAGWIGNVYDWAKKKEDLGNNASAEKG